MSGMEVGARVKIKRFSIVEGKSRKDEPVFSVTTAEVCENRGPCCRNDIRKEDSRSN